MTADSNPKHSPSRRKLLLQATAALAAPWLPVARSRAAVAGNNATTSWAVTSDPGIFTLAWNAKFSNALVNPLSTTSLPGLNATGFYKPDAGSTNHFTVVATAAKANVLGVAGKPTNVWGYKNYETAVATFPGRSFQVQRNQTITVAWRNQLVGPAGPLPHLMPVDQTITIQSPTTGVPLAVHHHGGDTAPEFDGGPDQWATPVRRQVGPGITTANVEVTGSGVQYQYLNAQEASMHWYHDHADSLTRINVNAGLAGLYVVRDANEAGLQAAGVIPRAPYEVALVLQDRCFDSQGNMCYAADPNHYPGDPDKPPHLDMTSPTHYPEMFGDVMLVNGMAWPNLKVEPRPYRVRLLNGSDSRFYTLRFGNLPVYMIGNDLGLLNNGVAMSTVTIAPGERVDLVVDFSFATMQNIVVRNSAPTPFPGGTPPTGGAAQVMRFQVGLFPDLLAAPMTSALLLPLQRLRRTTDSAPLPAPAAALAALPKPTVVRHVLLGEGQDQYGRITPMLGTYHPLNAATNFGTLTFADPPTERPTVGSSEVWEFWNTTVDAHPVHMHLVQFRILDRQTFSAPPLVITSMSNGWSGVKLAGTVTRTGVAVPSAPHEQGWKDTVVCPPGVVTRVLVSFNRRGKYVYHCHILSHEEHDMMRWYQVV